MLRKMVTSRRGRKCKHRGCKHILSIYNHESFCHVHAHEKFKHPPFKPGKLIK